MPVVTVSAAQGRPISRAKGLPAVLELPEGATVKDAKTTLAKQFPKDRRDALKDECTLDPFKSGQLWVKDLGPQISWRTVFLVEYVGPMLIHPAFYHMPRLFYGKNVKHSDLQTLVYTLVMLHFGKRELETIFVHRFSHATMPFNNIFRNSAHYWLISGVALAYALYSPTFAWSSSYVRGTYRSNPYFLLACTAVWAFAELSNAKTHWTLRNLRPAGTTTRAVPQGYGFSLVSCPNYFFEIMGWAVIAVMSGSYVAWTFTGFSAFIMTQWAVKKHRAYKREFGREYPRRKAIIPFIY